MRTLVLLLFALPLFAQFTPAPITQTNTLDELLLRAQKDKKAVVVFFGTPDCPRCLDVIRVSVPHPTIQRRLPKVVFGFMRAKPGEAAHVALFDHSGVKRATWPLIPDTMNLGLLLDNAAGVAPHFARAVELGPGEGDLEVAQAMIKLGRISDARAALDSARTTGNETTRQKAAQMLASLEAALDAMKRSSREAVPPAMPTVRAEQPFSVRIVAPREGYAHGRVEVGVRVRVPEQHRVKRVAVSWNDVERTVLTAEPWETRVHIEEGEAGVLRVVGELDDGRTSEDAVLLNTIAERADVHVVELPLTISREVTAREIVVTEGKVRRKVDSIATAAETPLTVGLLIDTSGSMQRILPDLQEAAIRFLQTLLTERDRAFLVAFDTSARLLQPATSDTELLAQKIMTLDPSGQTALHDAMVLGLSQFAGVKGRRALIVFTDGFDISSRYSSRDVRELARRMNVPVHVLSGGRQETMTRVARSTGGTSQTLRALSELPAIYARIGYALRGQILAYVRTDAATKPNDWREVRVTVKGAEVWAPEGYYASQ
jgi:VWFA-related protein